MKMIAASAQEEQNAKNIANFHRLKKSLINRRYKDMMNLQENKENALNAYKEAKKAYLENMTSENWKAFCNAKIVCMRLGVII